jgi:hypothetical protein
MKVVAHHDADGNIRSLQSFEGPEEITLMLTPGPGAYVSEVDGVKVESGERGIETLAELAKTHKVSVPSRRCTLEKTKYER